MTSVAAGASELSGDLGGIAVEPYLRRLNYSGPLTRTVETLQALQLAHLLAVPFENLSIHSGERIVLNDAALFDKIVIRRRGGFCYELNGLFAALLHELGFDVQMLSASVANSEGVWGPDFDHMTLMVTLGDRWLVDVGFGDSFVEPLRLDQGTEQVQGNRSYRLENEGDQLTLLQKIGDGDWKPQYRFTLVPHVYKDYEEMCHFQQTSPDSHFTRRVICSRLTPEGRITISDKRLITTVGNERSERDLSDEETPGVLQELFGIRMSE
ncbi:MAG TPA: arylamine N-acetyltransferase [Pyrinomonadaceae bacterium]|nr:arylamine N-acetyltransferase [Pyrinomonadaceae bacterium]